VESGERELDSGESERERESGEGRTAGKVCNGRPSKRKEVKKEKGSLFDRGGGAFKEKRRLSLADQSATNKSQITSVKRENKEQGVD
jgi:hypothetical protein